MWFSRALQRSDRLYSRVGLLRRAHPSLSDDPVQGFEAADTGRIPSRMMSNSDVVVSVNNGVMLTVGLVR